MSGLSRRDLLKASAGAAAIAVPMSVLSGPATSAAAAHGTAPAAATGAAATGGAASATEAAELAGPVIFSIRDVRAGEVSILHGSSEVIVHDRQLVDRILRAARRNA